MYLRNGAHTYMSKVKTATYRFGLARRVIVAFPTRLR
jgi:hypothetical protein